ncbi:hypothetical protein [Fodinicola feengrottensis]|uniref:Uncharacterized protein n=1 Tax=Fodinicola feengrottensis TaxID=435914 RepID=A0ABP4S882_9ACTN|nr:hypothetical protein [Fodinicola feengrottensis]
MTTIIVPVGFGNGPRFGIDGGPEPAFYEVLRADESIALPHGAYQVWLTAHADIEAHATLAFTRDRLVELAEPSVGSGTAGLVDRLISSRVLAEYEPGSGSALEFLRTHRLYPTAEGLGNTAEEPEMFRIGKNGEVLLEVIPDVYTFWCGSYNSTSIWDDIVKYDREFEEEQPLTVEELAQMFSAAIPMIVAARCGFLEPL